MALLDTTVGAQLIGIILSVYCLGFTTIQTWYYFRHFDDGLRNKLSVSLVCLLEFLHAIFGLQAMYEILVSHYADPTFLTKVPWCLLISCGCVVWTAFVVNLFYSLRIYYVSQGKWYMSALIVPFTLAHSVIVWYVLGVTLVNNDMETFMRAEAKYSRMAIAFGICADFLVAASLCYFLHKSRTGFKKTNNLINQLLLYSLRNGVITTVVTVIALGFHIGMNGTQVYLSFYHVMGTCYANSFLATMNARKKARKMLGPNDYHMETTLKFGTSGSRTVNNGTQEIYVERSVVTMGDPEIATPTIEKVHSHSDESEK